jgi:hypothetical protein
MLGSGRKPRDERGFNAPTSELSVNTRFTVEMLRRNPFDYVLIGESLN